MSEIEPARIRPDEVPQKLRRLFSKMIQQTFLSPITRALQQKEAGCLTSDIFKDADLAEHFAHIYLPDLASQNVSRVFVIDRIRFIENDLGGGCIRQDTFINIWNMDGIFFKTLKKTDRVPFFQMPPSGISGGGIWK